MTTSRTGTAAHRRFRTEVLRRAQDQDITHCPECTVPLNYDQGRLPNSAEPDHIIPVTLGGTNHPDNGRVICRRCNQRRGNHLLKRRTDDTPTTTTNLVKW